MEERTNHLTVVIGATAIAEELRRSLVSHGVLHAGVGTHLRGLRQLMLLGEPDLVVICIAMDRTTLQRYGESLRRLLADHHCFPQQVRSVGLLDEIGLTSELAELGCDLFVHDSSQAMQAIDLLTRRWELCKAEQRLEANRLSSASDREQDASVFVLDALKLESTALMAGEIAEQGTLRGSSNS